MTTYEHKNNETYLAIREETLNRAIRDDGLIKIVVGGKEYVRDARKWKDTGRYSEQVFKRPDEPLKLWWNNVLKEEPNENQLTLEL